MFSNKYPYIVIHLGVYGNTLCGEFASEKMARDSIKEYKKFIITLAGAFARRREYAIYYSPSDEYITEPPFSFNEE